MGRDGGLSLDWFPLSPSFIFDEGCVTPSILSSVCPHFLLCVLGGFVISPNKTVLARMGSRGTEVQSRLLSQVT